MALVRPPIGSRLAPARARAIIAVALVLTVVCWQSPLVAPLRTFVVFVHEASHAAAALATGGVVERMTVDAFEGGSCETRGGHELLVLSAGYIGSMLLGGLLVLLAARTSLDRLVTFLVGLALFGLTARYVDNEFGREFGYAAAMFSLIAAVSLSELVCEIILVQAGVTSCLYAVFDILSDIFFRSGHPVSDAVLMAEATGIPVWFWGALWLVLAVWGTSFFLTWAVYGKPFGGSSAAPTTPSTASSSPPDAEPQLEG